ncbi:MAG TPA: metalloregulator ArsR/SmtB family transcription factor [Rectinema sp.]|jgi:ArsR family transcriptional regulator|nr:metalloregulator ArsR/SmtB family transcription factor [Rectinema sp.]HOH17252.1 metalloregulator ArsR/SmtB family transcription factor [Rectinema sp.]HOO02603.1 metalloregulator ArsR/SmtB family transcription factor [Rectinema sp.]HPK79766.1 metalloregulator ArsR/SmtB family transcription factor [Rectinema sp.]HQH88483.1 metalloregulator ArsR/SmtB family transcription factor [Rectinema sp.]
MGSVEGSIMTDDLCSQYSITCGAEAEKLRNSIMDIAGVSEIFKALSDETRTKILYLISKRELCVCDLAFLLDMTLPAVSHHLRFLRTMRLVKTRKEGKNVFYSLDDNHVLALIEQAKEHYIERT